MHKNIIIKHMHLRHVCKQHVFKQPCSNIQLSSKDGLKKKKKGKKIHVPIKRRISNRPQMTKLLCLMFVSWWHSVSAINCMSETDLRWQFHMLSHTRKSNLLPHPLPLCCPTHTKDANRTGLDEAASLICIFGVKVATNLLPHPVQLLPHSHQRQRSNVLPRPFSVCCATLTPKMQIKLTASSTPSLLPYSHQSQRSNLLPRPVQLLPHSHQRHKSNLLPRPFSVCCHTHTKDANQTCCLVQCQYSDTGPTSPTTEPTLPGVWQGSHYSTKV